jgi:transcriptional regulator with XRE-family HTH domain
LSAAEPGGGGRGGGPDRAPATSAEATRQRELGAFLRAHRERLKPDAIGLPSGARRRTPGLRREEVAALSGLGLAWYTWLEQGRVAASRPVVEAVSRTLRLDADARRHALTLAGHYIPPAGRRHDETVKLLRPMLDGWPTSPALLLDRRFDVTAANEAYRALWGDPAGLAPARRNLLWIVLADPAIRTRMLGWESVGLDLLARFRAQVSLLTEDRRVQEIYRLLEADAPELRTWWECRSVREFRARPVTVSHPDLGRGEFTLSCMRPADDPDATIVVQTPVGPADRDLVAAACRRARAARARQPVATG